MNFYVMLCVRFLFINFQLLQRLYFYHYVSPIVSCFNVFVGFGGLLQGETGINYRLYLSLFDKILYENQILGFWGCNSTNYFLSAFD